MQASVFHGPFELRKRLEKKNSKPFCYNNVVISNATSLHESLHLLIIWWQHHVLPCVDYIMFYKSLSQSLSYLILKPPLGDERKLSSPGNWGSSGRMRLFGTTGQWVAELDTRTYSCQSEYWQFSRLADASAHNWPRPRHPDSIPRMTLKVWPAYNGVLGLFLK